MSNGFCYIMSAGDAYDKKIELNEDDCLICADAGLRNAHIFSRNPDFIVGDFDSYGEVPQLPNVVVYPCEKDYSDTFFAVKKGLEKGYKKFVLLGALGGDRPEHSVANLQNFPYICENDGIAFMLHKDSVFLAVKNKTVTFKSDCVGYVSVFSLKDKSCGVTEENLKYTLENADLLSSPALGLSNEFVSGKEARISVKDGVLLIIWKGKISDCIIKE